MRYEKLIEESFKNILQSAEEASFEPIVKKTGIISDIGDGIIDVENLDASYYELLILPHNLEALVLNISKKSIKAVVLGDYTLLNVGDEVEKSGKGISVGVGYNLLGRIIDPLGKPLDERDTPQYELKYPIESEALPFFKRDFVKEPMYTGIKIVDAMIPIGKGQRELIIGDSSTGKTSIAIDAIINQYDKDVYCVYVSIGQKKAQVARIIEELQRNEALSHTVVVAATADDSAGLKFIAPYAGSAIAEFFRDEGKDVLIVYDDLTKHADSYRMLSLLLQIPPGREAYPGDIFFVHSRLLERAGKRDIKYGGGSITALPIVETQAGKISAYIPTNLISITDGQIYLDRELFNKGFLPAIDIGKSVSRIGSKAQVPALKKMASRLKLDYSQFLEVEVFTKFGAKLEDETMNLIKKGEALRETLKQGRSVRLDMPKQAVTFFLYNNGFLEKLEIDKISDFVNEFLEYLEISYPDILTLIADTGDMDESTLSTLEKVAAQFFEEFNK
ncbi:F0F1 ATP synthase subunit alpha [Nitrosophilus alvini]|uniref:F0F1 ATP synthase subunit alpha n=1 Tax=Nitrosophilus alvini TaxID=2714855 RepID=UPI00190B4ECC|nr:F0F1 ATP synthase subunit alpha [Nitrosophilus alvini]